jgi:hypothetical protein
MTKVREFRHKNLIEVIGIYGKEQQYFLVLEPGLTRSSKLNHKRCYEYRKIYQRECNISEDKDEYYDLRCQSTQVYSLP